MQSGNKTGNRFSTVISSMLCFLFVLQIVNKSFYTHSHLLENGNIITHAHPYNRSSDDHPFKSHHHSRSELFFLGCLKVLFPVLFAFAALLFFPKRTEHHIFRNVAYLSVYSDNHRGRSPPVQV
ncbi:MAG: hypothetical protein PVF73_04420 [Bacteroidales bacterium]|jgi:hypothetical protein